MSKFDRSVRDIILINSKLTSIQKAKYLFHEGDQAHHMYIILRGIVSVRGYFKPCRGEINLNTMQDGDHFGDISFLQQMIKHSSEPEGTAKKVESIRTASCLALEDTYLLEIPAKIVQETFRMSIVNVDLDHRVMFLSTMSIFSSMP